MSAHLPFIVLESLDGAGGSTQLALLQRRLKKEKYTPHTFHFPQEDRATGQLVYEKYLRDTTGRTWSRKEQSLIYIQDFFSRLEEMRSLVERGKKGTVVISDRYCTSTMAYQTVGLSGEPRRIFLEWIEWLCWQGKPQLLTPDLVLLLDIPTETALRRMENKKKDRHERQEMMRTVRRSYLRLAQERGWAVIPSVTDGGEERTRQNIHEDIWQVVAKLIS